MKKFGIVSAMMAEARTLIQDPSAHGPFILLEGGGLLTVSGIGARRAQIAARGLLEHGATALVSWGTAGGLTADLRPGSLVLPRTILAVQGREYAVDPLWHEGLRDRLDNSMDVHSGPLAESTSVLIGRKNKEALFYRTNAVAVDMESAAVAAVASQARMPFIAIRAISDQVDTDLPLTALKAFDTFGRVNRWKFLRGFLQHPEEILAWMRFCRQLHTALSTLVTVTRLAGNKLMVPE